MNEIPEPLAEHIVGLAEIELTTYFRRAVAVQQQRGSVSVASCVAQDDIDALHRSIAIATFARTLGTEIGMSAHDAERLDYLIGSLGGLIAQLYDPDTNWKEAHHAE